MGPFVTPSGRPLVHGFPLPVPAAPAPLQLVPRLPRAMAGAVPVVSTVEAAGAVAPTIVVAAGGGRRTEGRGLEIGQQQWDHTSRRSLWGCGSQCPASTATTATTQ